MGIMMSSCDVTAHDNDGVEIPAKNTYPYLYLSLRDMSEVVFVFKFVCEFLCELMCVCV